jgi:hypothetical protein
MAASLPQQPAPPSSPTNGLATAPRATATELLPSTLRGPSPRVPRAQDGGSDGGGDLSPLAARGRQALRRTLTVAHITREMHSKAEVKPIVTPAGNVYPPMPVGIDQSIPDISKNRTPRSLSSESPWCMRLSDRPVDLAAAPLPRLTACSCCCLLLHDSLRVGLVSPHR